MWSIPYGAEVYHALSKRSHTTGTPIVKMADEILTFFIQDASRWGLALSAQTV
jgi:hypothetical protein